MDDACELVAVGDCDHIFRCSDTLTLRGVSGASAFRALVGRDFHKVLRAINDCFRGPVVARYR